MKCFAILGFDSNSLFLLYYILLKLGNFLLELMAGGLKMTTVGNSHIFRSILLFIVVFFVGFSVQAQNGGETFVHGELTEDTTWAETVVLEETVTIPAGIILNIKPGTKVSMMDSVSLIVYGQLIADGNEAEPIRFTRHTDDITWKQIIFIEAENSRFAHCIFEYADCEGRHQDYYEPGPRWPTRPTMRCNCARPSRSTNSSTA